ncbi:diguanylate cyclase domain-containing protein [Devosia naphthalenivorans]|uniref:diguanylate cyclase domain-containing protein n=1 Tax=Devosia naphthalenivorans TaxID=2082392 RepID=UPI0013B067CA|nr:diguanylate cyclase [Devosia naphthalenivorans]
MALVAMTRARCGRRSKDTALPLAVMGRLGGDEFALVLNIADGEPRAAAKAMLHAIRQIGPTSASGSRLGASIGLAVVDGSGTTPADVLARADDACYAAKSMGRNCWQFEAEQPSGSGMTAAQLVADLATGMGEGRLVLFGQEIRVLDRPDQAAGRIEVLVRLRSRDGRLVSPAEFIPAAERFGMAAALDRHVIRTALRSFGQLLSARTDMSLSHSRKPPSYRADRDHETLKNCAA